MSTKKRKEELQFLAQEALDAYLNREEFHYDTNSDAMYQQYRDQYQRMGKAAMEDTMGQATALTGGYGSSYAQNVGQQAYNGYLRELNDVVPELYALAYERYQNQGDRLYQAYEAYAKAGEEAAEQERWEQELAEKQRQFDQSQSKANSTTQETPKTYAEWRGYKQGAGTYQDPADDRVIHQYDNGDVTNGNILIMQRVLGLPETGFWTSRETRAAGNRTADQAWARYQQGQLQQMHTPEVNTNTMPMANVQAMERALGRNPDGYWSDDDRAAAGGLELWEAWEQYQQGKLQLRRS